METKAVPNESYYLACEDGIRRLSTHSDGHYAVEMLSTLLNPRESGFVVNADALFANRDPASSTLLFNTEWYFSQTGEPHLVTFTSLANDDLIFQGMTLNHSFRHLFPMGISLNVVQIVNKRTIRVTTFERGVLRITASCGSGSTSAAVLAYKLGLLESPHMQVVTAGGILEIIFKDNQATKIGPATIEFDHPSYIELEIYHD